MKTIQLLQKIAETPRYNDNFSVLLNAQKCLMESSEKTNRNQFYSKSGWDEGSFQADITIQVDID